MFKHERFGSEPLLPWMKQAMCIGSETNPTQCGTWCTAHICSDCDIHHFDVGISCIGEYATCPQTACDLPLLLPLCKLNIY